MSKFKEKVLDESFAWKPSAHDAQRLSDKLNAFEKKVVNGKKQYPFELYLEDEGIISFGEFGQIQVRNTIMYDRMNRTEDLRRWIGEQEQENMFNAFPEEREAHQIRIKEIINAMKLSWNYK